MSWFKLYPLNVTKRTAKEKGAEQKEEPEVAVVDGKTL
jgi:hypothetical protein